MKTTPRRIIGLVPAAGKANRLSPLPFSKELYPINYKDFGNGQNGHPRAVMQYLLEKMRLADVSEVYIVLRKGKWDIPAYFGDGKMLYMNLAYVIMNQPFGVPFSIDQVYPFAKDALVVFGFPDIVFKPEDVFAKVLKRQMESAADMVLGLFPVDEPNKWDMVKLDHADRILGIECRPNHTDLKYTWIIAAWTPVFTNFLHDYLRRLIVSNQVLERKEISMGDVIQAAIENNLLVDGVTFAKGFCLDIGTSDDLMKIVNNTNRV